MTKVYLSGPITNASPFMQQLNIQVFVTAAFGLRAQGLQVVNPTENGLPADAAWKDHMRTDIRALMDCTRIHMLPGWQRSAGARLEHHIAYELGFEVTGASE
jgi:hypothetical protein